MKPLDWLFVVLSVSLTVGTAWAVFAPSDAPLSVEVQDSGGRALYPLDQDRIISAQGPLGVTEIHIENRAVFVHDSPCANKVCIAMGSIHSSGQFVACLPNRVFVRISGGTPNPEAIDASVW